MIILDIEESPDSDIRGEYQTFKNDLIIGKSTSADLPIADEQIFDIHCIFRLLPTHLYIRSIAGSSFFLLNGKKFSGEKKLIPGDKITLGLTTIIIKQANYDPKSSPGDFKDYYKKTILEYPETGILLEVLEREIINLSKQDPTAIRIK